MALSSTSSMMSELLPSAALLDTLPSAYTELCDSLRVERSWRNVQPILLATFTSVAQLLTTQAQQIQALQHELTRLQQAATNERDATAQQITEALAPLQEQLADVTSDSHHDRQAARVLAQVQERFVSNETAAAVAEEQRAAITEVHALLCRVLITSVAYHHASHTHRPTDWTLSLQLNANLNSTITERLESWQTQVESKWHNVHQHSTEHHTQAIEALRDEQQQAIERATHAMERFVSHQVAEALATVKHEQSPSVARADSATASELASLEAKLTKQLHTCQEELASSLNAKTSRADVLALVSQQLDALTTWQQRIETTHTTRLDDVARSLQDSVTQTHATMANSVAQLKQNLHELLSVVESLQHEASELQTAISQKIDVDDAQELVESHTTLVGLERAMHELTQDFSSKTDVQRVSEQVQWLKQQLRSEMYQARFIWKEGRPSTQQTIAWTAQVVNTHTDVFVWQTGSDRVLLKIPGLYHLQAAFFTDFSPTICVLVNGEPALAFTGSDGDDVCESGGDAVHAAVSPVRSNSSQSSKSSPRSRATDATCQYAMRTYRRVHHSAGNIVGLSLDAFLALPARAVVQISYDIQERAQGFLNLRKL